MISDEEFDLMILRIDNLTAMLPAAVEQRPLWQQLFVAQKGWIATMKLLAEAYRRLRDASLEQEMDAMTDGMRTNISALEAEIAGLL